MSSQTDDRERIARILATLAPAALLQAASYVAALADAPPDSQGMMATLGLKSGEKESGRATMEIQIGPHLMNPHGVLHGGALFAAMDTAMGGAVTSLLEEGETCTTVEAKINYLAAVTGGILTATANVVQKGARVAVVEARATTGDGRLAGIMTGTFMIVRRQAS